MTRDAFKRAFPPGRARFDEWRLKWPDAAHRRREFAPGVAPLPGRVFLAFDLVPEHTPSGILLPPTNRLYESGGDVADPFASCGATVIESGDRRLEPWSAVMVRPYQGMRIEEFAGIRSCGFVGGPLGDAAHDIVATKVGEIGEWRLFADWIAIDAVDTGGAIDVPGGRSSDRWRVAAVGPDADPAIKPGDEVVVAADRRSPDWDCSFLWSESSPFGDGLCFLRSRTLTGAPTVEAIVDARLQDPQEEESNVGGGRYPCDRRR